MGELFVIAFLIVLIGLLWSDYWLIGLTGLGLMLFWNHQRQINALLKRIHDLEQQQLRSKADRPNPLPETELTRTVPAPPRDV